jgi:hypothetical protein
MIVLTPEDKRIQAVMKRAAERGISSYEKLAHGCKFDPNAKPARATVPNLADFAKRNDIVLRVFEPQAQSQAQPKATVPNLADFAKRKPQAQLTFGNFYNPAWAVYNAKKEKLADVALAKAEAEAAARAKAEAEDAAEGWTTVRSKKGAW